MSRYRLVDGKFYVQSSAILRHLNVRAMRQVSLILQLCCSWNINKTVELAFDDIYCAIVSFASAMYYVVDKL